MLDTRITVIGNLAADPVHRALDGGQTVTNFRIGSTPRRFDRRESAWVDGATSWWEVSCFSHLAENAAASFRKGDRVLVSGRARIDQWQVRDTEGAVEKSGTTARITADALGHELTHGTSTFARVVRARELPLPTREELAASLGARVDANGELHERDDVDEALAEELEGQAVPA